jgi:hypothetical protein
MKKTPASKSFVFIKELFYTCAAVLFINSFVLASLKGNDAAPQTGEF